MTPAKLVEIARAHARHDDEVKWSGAHADAHEHRGLLLEEVKRTAAKLAEIGENAGWLFDYLQEYPEAVALLQALKLNRWDDAAIKHLTAVVRGGG